MASQFYDANLAIPGCDKNMPGCIMAMGRVNRPSVMVYGGTIRAGCPPALLRRRLAGPRARLRHLLRARPAFHRPCPEGGQATAQSTAQPLPRVLELAAFEAAASDPAALPHERRPAGGGGEARHHLSLPGLRAVRHG